jgi:tetratricopeptide (TPR) repeat protein
VSRFRARGALLPIAAAMFASIPARTDDIVLHGGEVVEGKVDRAATEAANRGKDPSNRVTVIETDDRGTKRTLRNAEISHVVPKKTSWEARKEALAWYEAQKEKAKDSLAAWESFGRQCRARKLDELATEAYRKAYGFRRADLEKRAKRGADDHLALAKWCSKSGLMEEEAEQLRAALETKRQEAAASGDPSKALLDVATWCMKQDLVDEAGALFEEVLKADPSNAKAAAGLKSVQENESTKFHGLAKEYIAAGRAFKIRVAVEDNANAQFMETWKEFLESVSDYMFEITEGQFFVYEWTLEDQTSNGKLIIDKGKLEFQSMNGKAVAGLLAYCKSGGTPEWEVHCPGRTWEANVVHELMHGLFGLPDEYNQNPKCACLMRSHPNPQHLCVASTHKGRGESCWDRIKKRFQGVVQPNPNWKVTKQGFHGRVKEELVDGELTIGKHTLTQAPMCKVIVIDH